MAISGLTNANVAAEHRVVQDEGDEDIPPSTSCFLESEEGSVSCSLYPFVDADHSKTFTVCVDMNQASIFRPNDELTITVYGDGRRIAYLSPSRESARYKIQQISTMVSDDQGRRVEGRLLFTTLVCQLCSTSSADASLIIENQR